VVTTPSQALPEGFDNTIATGTPAPVDQQKLHVAQTSIALQKAKAASNMTAYTKAKAEAAKQMALYNKKGATPAQRAAATRARNTQLDLMKRETTSRNAALKAQSGAQSAVYSLTGQYDKLLQGADRDAFAALKSLFDGFGLGSLAGKIFDYVKQGYGADTVSLLLQDTSEYKTRFAGNEARTKAGLPVLSPAEYLATEDSYRQILQDSGMPKGMYDNPADFTKWISGDVSPTELKGRVDQASAAMTQFNPYAVQTLDALYGIDSSHLLAYAFDRNVALPELQKQYAAAQFGGEAASRGLATDKTRLENYVTQGLSLSTASQGFEQVAEELPNLQAIADRWGTTFNQAEEEGSVFGTSDTAVTKKKGLASQERALFNSSQGSSSAGLNGGNFQT
jgi:hypothetical protein